MPRSAGLVLLMPVTTRSRLIESKRTDIVVVGEHRPRFPSTVTTISERVSKFVYAKDVHFTHLFVVGYHYQALNDFRFVLSGAADSFQQALERLEVAALIEPLDSASSAIKG